MPGATGYFLFYAPNPFEEVESISVANMGTKTDALFDLWEGAAFYVAIQAYDSIEAGLFSNIIKIAIGNLSPRHFQRQPSGVTAIYWGLHPGQPGSSFNYPAFTIEVRRDEFSRVTWTNGLVDESGRYLPHLLAVDRTLHWVSFTKDQFPS